MDINNARETIRQIGAAYFEDEIGNFTINEIIGQIKNFIFQTSKLQGIFEWEHELQAIRIVLSTFTNDQLDQIILTEYGIFPESVNGARFFLENLAEEMEIAIRQKKLILLNL
jgi:hypothetical protein